jgi:hypothetical protein
MAFRTGIAAALGAALLLLDTAARAQVAVERGVVDAPHTPDEPVTRGLPWQQQSAEPVAAHSATPEAPMYGAPAHWSAPPPSGWTPMADSGWRTESRWYGWQTLVADGASLTLLAVGISLESSALSAAGLLGYALGSPAVHVGHVRPLTALGSTGLRIALPATGMLLGPALGSCHHDEEPSLASCTTESRVVGSLIGAAVAIALDASWLARDSVPEQPAPRKLSLTPTLELARERQVLGVQGSF